MAEGPPFAASATSLASSRHHRGDGLRVTGRHGVSRNPPSARPSTAPRPETRSKGESPSIDMLEEWLSALRAWPAANSNVPELWLFGSRASGKARPDGDVDLATALMRQAGRTIGRSKYEAIGDPLMAAVVREIVGRHVSLDAIVPETPSRAGSHRGGSGLFIILGRRCNRRRYGEAAGISFGQVQGRLDRFPKQQGCFDPPDASR